MLTEMIYSKEFFGLIVFTEFINVDQMFKSDVLITREIRKFFVTLVIDIV